MSFPEPKPGLIIRYSYKWHNQDNAENDGEEGLKDRPCAVVVSQKTEDGTTRVMTVPITHREPVDNPNAVELPLEFKKKIGLDEDRSWIITNEVNEFKWIGPDVRSISGRDNNSYGFLTPGLLKKLGKALEENFKTKNLQRVLRTE